MFYSRLFYTESKNQVKFHEFSLHLPHGQREQQCGGVHHVDGEVS
jgi:hypothetical protein